MALESNLPDQPDEARGRGLVSWTTNSAGAMALRLAGDWKSAPGLPEIENLWRAWNVAVPLREISLEAGELTAWDSRLLAWLQQFAELCVDQGLTLRTERLPAGMRTLLVLASAVPEKRDARKIAKRVSWVTRVGESVLASWANVIAAITFLGDCVLSFGRMVRGQARFRAIDVVQVMRETGPGALPIVAVINILVGMILGFVGAVQLGRFGASIYVADLVAVAVVREMGAIMTGIIMCGRTGAAFAAQLGSMKVNEEIDALRTLGFAPMEYLVLPRMAALFLMMPLLVVFANALGVLGGFVVAVAMLEIPVIQYWNETIAAISLTNYFLGISKGACFGLIVALTGCFQGVRCGSDAAAVGRATTQAVVTGITWVIVADALFAVVCNIFGI